MKKIFVAMLALAAATACSNDELVSVNQEAIGFDNAFINNSVRADHVDYSITQNDLKGTGEKSGFGVYGFVTGVGNNAETASLFTNKKVYWSNNAWKYDATQYWIAGASYNFAAIAPYSDANVNAGLWTVTEATPGSTTLAFEDATGFKDLLYATATATGKVSGNGAVAFNFRHVLSKVMFTYENQYNADDTTIAIRWTSVSNAHTAANVTLTAEDAVWSGHSGAETGYRSEFGPASQYQGSGGIVPTKIACGDSEISFRELFFIPVAVDETTGEAIPHTYLVDFQVEIYVKDTLIKTITHNDKELTFAPKPGCSYNVKVTINSDNIDPSNPQEPIEFTVNEIGGWNTDEDPSMTL